MHYTILPLTEIFPEERANSEFLNIKNGFIESEKVSEDEYRIIRLISTDPSAYLKFSPNQVIRNKSARPY